MSDTATRRVADRPRRVFLTGASSGIGAALARRYAQEGAVIGLLGRRRDALEALAAELSCTTWIHMADVADPVAMHVAGVAFIEQFGVPDIVIASAGVSAGTLTEYEEDARVFERIFQTNVLGMVHTFQPFIEPLRQAGAGTLVGIASVAGIRGLPGAGAYSASKAAARTYLESLRVEMHGSGVRVVTLSPGYIDTPMTRVNTYPMPFLMPADKAADRMASLIDRGRRHAVVPWQMGVVARVLGMLPRGLYDRLFARAGRKPRQLPL